MSRNANFLQPKRAWDCRLPKRVSWNRQVKVVIADTTYYDAARFHGRCLILQPVQFETCAKIFYWPRFLGPERIPWEQGWNIARPPARTRERAVIWDVTQCSSVTSQRRHFLLLCKLEILWFYTDLFWLSLNNNFIHIILLAHFDKMQHLAVDDWFSVEFDNITGFVDLHPWAGGDS